MLRQEHYDLATGHVKIYEKSNDANMLDLMKSGCENTAIFPDGCRQMITDQLVEDLNLSSFYPIPGVILILRALANFLRTLTQK